MYTEKELIHALAIINTTIERCEKAHLKFAVGTSQYTLLKNRLHALYISRSLIICENISDTYLKIDILKSIPVISSTISKCEKAILKFDDKTPNYTKLDDLIKAMTVAKTYLLKEIDNKK